MKNKKPDNIFIQGPISATFIADKISRHQDKTNIGAHSIFLGQVRADNITGKTVSAIEYSSYESMALETMQMIREQLFAKHSLTCMHVYHSLGIVNAGEICLFVFTSSQHRKAAIAACEEAVELIKNQLPIWGKELFEDASHQWKVNQ